MAIFSYYKGDGFFWFRLFNKGLVFKNTKKHMMIFSERYGKTKYIMVGKWLIKSVSNNG